MYRRSIHYKILTIVVGVLAVGVFVASYWALKNEKKRFLEEKLMMSRLMSRTVLSAIYKDMIEGRADMARHLMDILRTEQGVTRVQIIRSNGREEAFRDFKTIEAVKQRLGTLRPEWLDDHSSVTDNVAEGVDDPGFRDALSVFRKDWTSEPVYYTERGGRQFTYLQPIAEREDCRTCHGAEDARGILMISFSLDGMYGVLSRNRNQWIFSGLAAIFIGSVLLSLLIRRTVTGPIQKTVEVIEGITEGKGNITQRAEVSSNDEIGYLAKAFNTMLDSLEKRDEENRLLLKKIEKSRKEWVTTFDAIQDLISIHDNNYNIIRVNKALAARFNCEPRDLIGKKCFNVFNNCSSKPNPLCPHSRTLATGTVATDEDTGELGLKGNFNVTTFPIFNDDGDVVATVHIARDVTQEKILEQRLLHSEKMASLGKLVAGIAHELNNPLMGIMGFSQLLMEMPGDRRMEEAKDKLDRIFRESMRTAKIVQNLLTFARAKKPERGLHNINNVIRDTLELRGYSLKASNIEVVEDLSEDIPKSMVDYYQLQQVFINIISNAVDAMVSYRGKGRLEIRTRLKGRMIEITLADDGPGIPQDVITNVFDPFFTTKDVGKGTGLGLSISHGIIREHGGWIDVKSPRGGGTVVTIELPVSGQEAGGEGLTADGTVKPLSPIAGSRILVVDDEASIRDALTYILSAKGFNVTAAGDGVEALEVFSREKFSLAIVDIKMPGMNGIELFKHIREKHPDLKDRVIFLTGDVFSEDVKDFLKDTGCPCLTKPFEVNELVSLVSRILRDGVSPAV